MGNKVFIAGRVHQYYWHDDFNCATTNLKIQAEIFDIHLSEQVLAAALGMHGAGGYGEQCGLVEGGLMFLGIIGSAKGIAQKDIIAACYEYARQFEARFQSLLCRVLRPQGFHQDNPPHLCEQLSLEAVHFTAGFVADFIQSTRTKIA